jgi:PAS domain S-box-containing protein
MSNDLDSFKKMVENSHDWFWEFDEHANFTYASPRIKGLLGYDPEELLGLNAFDLMSSDEAERVHQHFDPIAKKYLPFDNLININRHKDGHEVVVESSGTPIFDEEGQFRGYRGVDRDITERKTMEENYRRLASLTSDYVHCCTRTGTDPFQVLWVDGAISSISGYRIEDVYGFGCFLPLVHPDDQQAVSDYLLSLVPGDCKSIEFRIVTPQQEIRWVSEKSQCEAGQSEGELILLGAVTDITERKQAEDALRKSQDLLAQTQQIGHIGSWLLEIGPNRLTWSEETYRIFGLEPHDFSATYEAFLEVVHPEDRATVDAAYSASLRGERDTYEIEHRITRKSSGEVRYVYEKCRHERDSRGAVIRSVGMVQDITDQKTNEVALLAATQATEAASRAKGLFLAKVSHEIRTPMTAIIGFGELLEDAELTPEHEKYLAAINTSSSALSSLIDDVLDLSKVDAGELSVKPINFNPHSLITQTFHTQEQQIARKNLSSNLIIDKDVPDVLIGDPVRLQQILLNLLNNAIKFTEEGEIDVTVSVTEESSLRVLLDIAVRDTGVGIPADLQEHIFEPFSQALPPDNNNYGGSGLGLTISRSLAALMGGTVSVESREGVGSTFHLLLPLQRESRSLSEKSLAECEPLTWSGPSLKILLAEDNPINSQFIKTVLENMGHVVKLAENGKVALDLLKVNTFDLALMDIQMPVMNGNDVLGVVRELEQLSGEHLTVIALTAYALIGDKEKYVMRGFDGYLSKPLKVEKLVKELMRVVPG